MIEVFDYLKFTSSMWTYVLPLALMGLDILTGLVNAVFKEKNFQSSVMREGLTKKIGEVAIIIAAIVISCGLDIPTYLLKAISLYISVMELMSVLENADKMGVPIPKFIKDFINNVHQTIENDSADELLNKLKKYESTLHRYEAVLAENHIDIDDMK